MARTPAGPCVAAQSADPALCWPWHGKPWRAIPTTICCCQAHGRLPGHSSRSWVRTIAGARRALVFRAVQGYAAGVALAFVLTTLAVSTRFGRDLLSTLTAMFNPLPAIAFAAAGHAVVRPGPGQPGFRIDSFRAVGNGCEYVLGLPDGVGNPAHGGAQLRTDGLALCAGDPGAGRAAFDPVGPAHCLGLCLAHVDRRRAGVRRVQRQRRAGLVHLPESQRVIHRSRFRRPGRRGADRPGCGKPGVRHAGARDGAPLGMQR